MKLDDLDKRLLLMLQKDAKITTKEISSKLNLSITAIYERIKKLEREKLIKDYVAILDKNKIGKGFVVFCHVKLIQHNKDLINEFEKQVTKLKEVMECYHVSGDYDYILKICLNNMEEYREFMVTKLTSLQHIGSTHSTFMIGEVKHSTVYEIT
jgi:Lrp/AsnC family transcriptional regulator, leucine-responsive regulatory protein